MNNTGFHDAKADLFLRREGSPSNPTVALLNLYLDGKVYRLCQHDDSNQGGLALVEVAKEDDWPKGPYTGIDLDELAIVDADAA